jgi:hypothetical protein
MNLLSTLKTNWRDLLAFIIIGLGLACLGGLIDYVSARVLEGGFWHLVLPTISNYLQGFSKFIGASVSATLLWMLLWPTVSSDANENFNEIFKQQSLAERMNIYLMLVLGALIAAAICFS